MKENQLVPAAQTALSYSFADVQSMAQVICQGNLFPSLKNPAQVLSLMLLCQAKGLHPMVAVERYHIIEGKPSMKADAMLSEFLSHGGKIEWQERSDVRVSAMFTAPNAGTVEVVWTIERARNAGLTSKGNWKSYPCQMLSARVISEGIGLTMPGVRMGIYTPEETMDFDTPAPRQAPAAELRPELPPRSFQRVTSGPTNDQINQAVRESGGRGTVATNLVPSGGDAITDPQRKALGAMKYPGSAAGWPSRSGMTKEQASQLIDYYNRHKTWDGAPGDPGQTTEAAEPAEDEEALTDPFAEEA
jgi:hypothetical protein